MLIKNVVLMIAGLVLFGLGMVGVALPVMPTTPFMIASAVCLSSGSPKISTWMENKSIFGSFIQNYRRKTGVPVKTKLISIICLWAGLIISMCISQKTILYVILAIVGICVTAHILLLKTRREPDGKGSITSDEDSVAD